MLRLFLPIIALALASTLLFSSCASRQTAATLDDIETYIQERPDSALATLRAIDTATLTTRSLRAHYALLHAMALDKNWIDTTDVNVVMPAVAYYSKHGAADRQARAWYYLGRIEENDRDYASASISFLKAENSLTDKSEPRFKALVYQALSNVYNETHFYEEALNYTERAYELFSQDGDTLNAYASLYRKAQDLNNLGRFAESDSVYRLLIASDQVHPNLRASLYCRFVTHSMGAAFAEGMADYLIESGFKVDIMVHLSPFQAGEIETQGAKDDILSIDIQTIGDPVLFLGGFSQGEIVGADHSIKKERQHPAKQFMFIHTETLNPSIWDEIIPIINSFLNYHQQH